MYVCVAGNGEMLVFFSFFRFHLWHLQRGILNPTLLEPAQEKRKTLQKEEQQRSLILLPYVRIGFEPINTD